MIYRAIFIWVLIFLHTIRLSFANNGEIKDTLQEVIVTGTISPFNTNKIPLSISVIDRNTIETSGESSVLKMLNGLVPGLFVTEKGVQGFGIAGVAAGQISIRGMGGSPTTGVLVLIDGNPQIMGIFGHPLSDTYLTAETERIEVVRGASSMLYGSNAMGGVVNIITRKPIKNGFSEEILLKYGTFRTSDIQLNSAYRNTKFDILLSVEKSHTDGHRLHSAFDLVNGFTKAKYRLTNSLSATANVAITNYEAEDPGPDTLGSNIGLNYNILRTSWSLGLEHWYKKSTSNILFYGNRGTHAITDGFHSDDFYKGLKLIESIQCSNDLILTAGLDAGIYGGKALNEHSGFQIIDTSLYEMGIYAQLHKTILKKLSLQAGIRRHFHSKYGSLWVPSGGATFIFGHGNAIKTSVSKGFRNPSLRELFMWNHNVDLVPENVWNFDFGYSTHFQTWNTNIEATFYCVNGSNLIVPGNFGKLYNTGIVRNKGIELSTSCSPLKNATLNLTYSRIHMEHSVYGTPKNALYLGSNYRTKKWNFKVGARWVDRLKTSMLVDDAAAYQTYTLLQANIAREISNNMDISILGENLLNQKYETIRYFRMPGITFSGNLRYHF